MTLISNSYDLATEPATQTYEQAQALRNNLVWQKLSTISLQEAISYWLPTLNHRIQFNYSSGTKKLIERGSVI